MKAQIGAGGIFVFVLLLLAMVFIAAMFTLSNTKNSGDMRSQTATSLANAATALEQYASQTGRLPCPADPTQDTGLEVPNGLVDCQVPAGTVPWATIGMRRDDAIDAWGWKIAYRVFSGSFGVTQPGGASMVNCDTDQALTTKQPVDLTTHLCQSGHDTLDSDFVVGKGLSVSDFGNTYDGTTPTTGGAAYVLISYGPSGFGAYTESGGQNPNQPKSTEEKNNLGLGDLSHPFVRKAPSDPTVPPDNNNHYDDILIYRTIADLAKKANLAARNWPDDVLAGAHFDQTTVQNAEAGNPLGSALDFGNFSVSGFDAGGVQNLGFTSGSTAGLGVASGGGGSNDLTNTGGEGLQFNFDDPARQFSVSLANFNSLGFFGSERAQLTFYSVSGNTATKIGNDVFKAACGLASTSSFTVDLSATRISDPNATFNRVEIRPATPTGFLPASTFHVEEIRTCVAGVTCQTSIYTTGDQC